MTYLLDTNVLSEWTKPRPEPNVVAWLAAVDEDRVHVSVCTFAEIRRGIELMPRGRRRDHLAVWLEDEVATRFADRVLGVDRRVAGAWGAVMARSQAAGVPLGTMDGFFAATALAHGLTLVTRNVRDFRAAGLPLLNPWDAPS